MKANNRSTFCTLCT